MQNKKPLVAIIMNCYNAGEFLREAIDSVLAQTYCNWEIIFWDNQSTDESANIVNSYNDDRIKYFYAPKFTKLYEARNYAIEKSSGDFISFLDCDDKWHQDKLEIQVNAMLKTRSDFCYSNYYKLYQNNQILKANQSTQPSGDILKYQIANYSIGILTVVISRMAWDSMEEKFDPVYNYPGDYDFFIRLLKKVHACYIDSPLAFYRIDNPNSISNIKKLDNIKESKQNIKKLKKTFSDVDFQKYFKVYQMKLNLKESVIYAQKGDIEYARKILSTYKFHGLKNFIMYCLTFIPNLLLFLIRNKK
ncbi:MULTISPECIES: glycosyltransferase family 2 protein [unclassified Campylobacter]|uniref:glycosyltransferase family 2 protein n=1 Tax=unclassified Campylobacter TaxID=2593542 RepID=UPI003D3346B0